MSWTEAERRKSRQEYARLYKPPHPRQFDDPVHVPENVRRVEIVEPCFMCGTARGVCRHRRWGLART